MGRAFARVGDVDWLSREEAARQLGLPGWRLRLLRANGHLQGAINDTGTVGYLRTSVDQEARWRRGASRWQRLRRAVGNPLDWMP